jgi:hypothetical protein
MSLLEAAAAWLVEPAQREADVEPVTGARPACHLELVTDPAGRSTRLITPQAHDATWAPAAATAALTRPAVIGTAATVPPLAAALALACRARAHVPAALVAFWPASSADPPRHRSGPILPGAATLASRLHRRDLPVVARGRLVWLTLPAEPSTAVTALRHAEAAVGDLPAVLAVARPRDDDVDALLAERDLLLVAAPPGSSLARAVAGDASTLGPPIHPTPPQPPGALRLATLAGLRGPSLEAMLRPELTA